MATNENKGGLVMFNNWKGVHLIDLPDWAIERIVDSGGIVAFIEINSQRFITKFKRK